MGKDQNAFHGHRDAGVKKQSAAAIRKEYVWVEEKPFNTKRAEILKNFLARPRIYATDFFANKFEQQARRNLEWSIRLLTKK